MRLIVVTTENLHSAEANAVNQLFGSGLDTLHLRKPNASEQQVVTLIEQIVPAYRNRIVLHDCFGLVQAYGLKGVHLNRRNPVAPNVTGISVSRSCHSLQELEEHEAYSYSFLSPIFNSISKAGYSQAFIAEELNEAKRRGVINSNTIALGGISEETIPQAKRYGFGGVAVLGALWGNYESSGDISTLLDRFNRLQNICKQL